MYKLWYPFHRNVYIVFFGFHCGCTNPPVAPNRFVSLYWAPQRLPLNYVDHFVEGCVFFMCVRKNLPVLLRLCACRGVTHGCERLGPDCTRLKVCVWQVCYGGGLCNVNKQQQQQQQLRWLPLSLSYVVIRSGWKCGTTVPLTITKHFSQAEDYRQKLDAVCSPLCVPHVTAPLATDPRPLFCHRPFRSAPQMCDMVTFNHSSDSPFVYTCMEVCACLCAPCKPIILQSVLPPTGWAWYWQWHLCLFKLHPRSGETNKLKHASNLFCICVNLDGVNCINKIAEVSEL